MIKKSDVVILDGKHVLMCGDSTSNDIFLALSALIKEQNNLSLLDWLAENNEKVMIYTDPPYNAAFNGRSGDHDIILNDKLEEEEFYNLIKSWYFKLKEVFGVKVPTYIWCNNYLKNIIENIDPTRWNIPNKKPIIWVKNNFGMGRNYRPKYEMCLFDGKIDKTILNECDIWEIKKDNGTNYIHPTQKPVECFERGMRNHKNVKYVIDSFAGSGSSLIASLNTQKIWLGMEYDEFYVEKIIRRYYDYTFTKDIKLLRNGVLYNFEYIVKEMKLLSGANNKGIIDKNTTRLF